MNNMYDILQKLNAVAHRQTLNEGRAVKEDDVEEGNKFTGELMKARAAGKKEADLDGDGDMEPVKEAKKAKPDFLDVDQDGNKKEPFKKAVSDKKKSKKPVKESLRLIKEASIGDRVIRVYHDREYQEYHVCIAEGDQIVSRQFAGSGREATDLVRGIISEARGVKLAISALDDPRTRFRKKFAPSVMGDPEGRAELSKLDTEYGERSKTAYGRGEDEDEDEEEGGRKARPAGEKRGRGRPKGSKRAIGAKGPTGRSKLLTREDYDADEYDEEGEMAMSQARTIEDAAEELQSILDADENLPEWVQKKISMAKDYIDTARDYLKANRPEDSDGEMPLPEGSTGDYSAKKARAGRDIGKPGKQFAKIAKSAGERYGSKERGEKVAGAVLAKLRAKESVNEDESSIRDDVAYEIEMILDRALAGEPQTDHIIDELGDMFDDIEASGDKAAMMAYEMMADVIDQDSSKQAIAARKALKLLQNKSVNEADVDESALQAYLGKKKYGKEGMAALQKAGREGAGKAKMDQIRARYDKLDEVELDEKAVSKAQRAAAGIARAAQKGEIPKSELRGASREMAKMPAGELKKFAKTKEKGLPEKKKEESVEETTTAGSVATAPAEGEKKSKGGIQFGKGVYEAKLAESFAAEMDKILGEGTTITINSPDSGEPSVSINGTGEDAMALGQLLKMAGLFSASGYQSSCATCGQMHEGECSVMEEDLANSADNTETMSTDYMVNGLSGGLNGPKQQVNPNNMGDNPLAMPSLGTKASPNLNLGAIAEQVELEDQQRMLDLYRKIAS